MELHEITVDRDITSILLHCMIGVRDNVPFLQCALCAPTRRACFKKPASFIQHLTTALHQAYQLVSTFKRTSGGGWC